MNKFYQHRAEEIGILGMYEEMAWPDFWTHDNIC